ncbi:unnamed protein product [Trifolium pratense]|uniref:Uncharacterized protein n=1 Tax=Trifolium pratense TaxID=57577 RepID=A0ACB0J8D6_TRIPR|nr:unnamed protein product [Trifolium pratense]
MGLKSNVKDIKVRLLRIFHVSTESSHMFLKRHPIFSCISLVLLIIYIFLSYIYIILAYMSPFLLCGAIFLRIFWSSEKTELRYVKKEEKKEEQPIKVEPKVPPPNIPWPNNIARHEQILFKYPSQNATSRRRNFRDRKWDVYGGLEEKAKDLSEVFQNEYTNRRNIEPFKKGESSVYYGLSSGRRSHLAPKRQPLRSEPSMVDLVECPDTEIEIEKMEDDDEEDAKDDVKNAIEWTENDQKNLMDVGNSEMERNRRLENLIARRRERKLSKLQIENGLLDKKTKTPSLMKPLHITRENCDIDDFDMPGSAPSVMPRSPYDIPYEPFEEKPNLRGDGFLQEFRKDVPFCRNGGFINLSSEMKQEHGNREGYSFLGRKVSDRHDYSRSRRHPDKGNHDWLIDQLMYNEGAEIGIQEPKSLSKRDEITHEEHGKCKTDIDDIKSNKFETGHDTKSMSDQTSKSTLTVPNISNVETNSVSPIPGSRMASRFSKSHERLFNIPNSSTNTTNINESMYENIPSPIDKRQEAMFLADRRLCHTPTYSIASDLQVEVSEVGSPTSTVDENGESNSSSDRDSAIYDGDIDRDINSGDEDLWGASCHGGGGVKAREEEDNNGEDVNNNSKDIVSPICLRPIDEDDAADVSSYSSRDEGPDDTPTCCVVKTDHNVFGNYMKYSIGKYEVPQSSHSSNETTPQNQLIGSSMDHLPDETHQGTQQERNNQSENSTNEAHVIDDVSNSTTIEQGNTQNLTSNEDPGRSTPVVRQESVDEVSNESISSSPRSVLPDKTISDEVLSPTFNQPMDIGSSQQSNMEDMTQDTLNHDEHEHDTMPQNIQPLVNDITDESHNVDFNQRMDIGSPQQSNIDDMPQETSNRGEHEHDTMPQNIQPLDDDITHESHNVDFNYSQEQTNHMENSIEESNIYRNMNDEEINRKEPQDKLNNGESSEDNSSHQISQEAATSEATKQIDKVETVEHMDEESRDLVDDKMPSTEVVEEDKH